MMTRKLVDTLCTIKVGRKCFLLGDEDKTKVLINKRSKCGCDRNRTGVLSWYCALIIVVKGTVVKLVHTLTDVLDRIIDV